MKNGYEKFFGNKKKKERSVTMTKSDLVMFDHMIERLATAEKIIKEVVESGTVTELSKKYYEQFALHGIKNESDKI